MTDARREVAARTGPNREPGPYVSPRCDLDTHDVLGTPSPAAGGACQSAALRARAHAATTTDRSLLHSMDGRRGAKQSMHALLLRPADILRRESKLAPQGRGENTA